MLTWSDGSYAAAYGNRGDLWAYARPSNGIKVNSIYVRVMNDPNNWLVEAGYASTGSNPGGGRPANHNPWFFSVAVRNGVYAEEHFNYQYALPVGERTRVNLNNKSGGNTFDVLYAGTWVMAWYGTFNHGMLTVGEERSLTSIDPRASMTLMSRLGWTGSDYEWYSWWYGVRDGTDGAYYFRFNHVGDPNHWVYCDDHAN